MWSFSFSLQCWPASGGRSNMASRWRSETRCRSWRSVTVLMRRLTCTHTFTNTHTHTLLHVHAHTHTWMHTHMDARTHKVTHTASSSIVSLPVSLLPHVNVHDVTHTKVICFSGTIYLGTTRGRVNHWTQGRSSFLLLIYILESNILNYSLKNSTQRNYFCL